VSASKPVLWHLGVSHYSEKARWALAWKGVEHDRRSAPAGSHMLVALWLTRGAGKTFPVLQLDGDALGDSSAIIAALEAYRPEPPLYPADPAERRRALDLEDFFDDELGPHIRRLAWHELRRDPERMAVFADSMTPGPLRRFGPARPAARWLGSVFVELRFRVASEEGAERAREKVLEALDRLESELERSGGGYLAGDSFSVADLTAASLLYPLVIPPEGPRQPTDVPPAFEEFRAPLRQRPGYRWVEEMYARHRKP
jgi:glutathione S-transferase